MSRGRRGGGRGDGRKEQARRHHPRCKHPRMTKPEAERAAGRQQKKYASPGVHFEAAHCPACGFWKVVEVDG